MSSPLMLIAISRISQTKVAELSNEPVLILLVYTLVLVPLALYVFHDIVDYRWRPIYNVVRYTIAYQLLYIVAATLLVGYAFIQWCGSDFKEVGAATVALILASYRVWTLFRLTAIIAGHRRLVKVLKECNLRLNELSFKPKQFEQIEYFLFRKPPQDVYDRHLHVSSSLFDDDYPGISARIRWLSRRARVHRNDVNVCTARFAVWMRVVMGSTDIHVLDELIDSKLRPFETGDSGKLYKMLLGQFMSTSAGELPAAVSKNPAEELINLDSVKSCHLRQLGAGIFWFVARVRDEEFGHIVADMPTRWMHQTERTGKKMMFEMGCVLMLSGMEIQDNSLRRLLEYRKADLNKSMTKEDDEEIMKLITNFYVQAIVMMTRYEQDEKESSEVIETGVSMMRDRFCAAGETKESFYIHMISMIRKAHFGAYIVESVLGEHIDHITFREGCSRLFFAELTFSVHAVLSATRDQNPFEHDSFEGVEYSLLTCDGRSVDNGGQLCPANSFRGFLKQAERAARTVYDTFKTR